jgi:hypothetical protein
MGEEEKRTTKRSRFDQTEPEPKRSSRFDRRSKSPPSRRSRSPTVNKVQNGSSDDQASKSGLDAASAAGKVFNPINFFFSFFKILTDFFVFH